MPPPDAAIAHYTQQTRIAEATVAAVDEIWAQVDPTAIDATWNIDAAVAAVARGQLRAASAADPYTDAVLIELGISTAATAKVAPRTFAGIASDGRALASLLATPSIAAKAATAAGLDLETAMGRGRHAAARIAGTQIADAGRVAVSTATIAHPAVTSWVRMINPPACSRCAILAGKTFSWKADFKRHPLCRCTAIPAAENVAGDLTTDPKTYFDSLSAADQDRYFTVAGADAIRSGGDMNQIVNATRGMYSTADGTVATRSGVTRRGAFGAAGGTGPRLMPESIIKIARDRSEALELLRQYRFLTT